LLAAINGLASAQYQLFKQLASQKLKSKNIVESWGYAKRISFKWGYLDEILLYFGSFDFVESIPKSI